MLAAITCIPTIMLFTTLFGEAISPRMIPLPTCLFWIRFFYFLGVAFIPLKASIGFIGSYTFLLAYLGIAKINLNNTAEGVIMQM